MVRDFNGCYLLKSLHPKSKNRTYIGFTVNPRRRIRQHNGLVAQGAWKTSRWRPWEMVLVVYGFPTQRQALQFEWAWQHPAKSKAVRDLAARLGSRGMTGVKGKMQLMLGMLSLAPWCYYPLTVHYLDSSHATTAAGCMRPPPHVHVLVGSLEDLPTCLRDDEDDMVAEDDVGSGSDEEGSVLVSQLPTLSQSQLSGQSKRGGAGSGAVTSGSGSEEDGEGDDADLAALGLTPDIARPPDGKHWMCALCGQAIERHVAHCTCRSGFHLECLAHHWVLQEHYDPLSDAEIPPPPRLTGLPDLPPLPTKRGRGRPPKQQAVASGPTASGPAASGASGAVTAAAGGALPEQGACPCCGKQHRWLDLLSNMIPYGYPVKERKRRTRKRRVVKAAVTASKDSPSKKSKVTKSASATATTATGKPPRGRAPKKQTATETSPTASPTRRSRRSGSRSSSRTSRSVSPESKGKRARRPRSSKATTNPTDGDPADLPTPKSSAKPRAYKPRARKTAQEAAAVDPANPAATAAGVFVPSGKAAARRRTGQAQKDTWAVHAALARELGMASDVGGGSDSDGIPAAKPRRRRGASQAAGEAVNGGRVSPMGPVTEGQRGGAGAGAGRRVWVADLTDDSDDGWMAPAAAAAPAAGRLPQLQLQPLECYAISSSDSEGAAASKPGDRRRVRPAADLPTLQAAAAADVRPLLPTLQAAGISQPAASGQWRHHRQPLAPVQATDSSSQQQPADSSQPAGLSLAERLKLRLLAKQQGGGQQQAGAHSVHLTEPPTTLAVAAVVPPGGAVDCAQLPRPAAPPAASHPSDCRSPAAPAAVPAASRHGGSPPHPHASAEASWQQLDSCSPPAGLAGTPAASGTPGGGCSSTRLALQARLVSTSCARPQARLLLGLAASAAPLLQRCLPPHVIPPSCITSTTSNRPPYRR